jgi:hypothetical protein
MLIDPSIEHGAFEPEATAAMSEAFEAACKELHEVGELQWYAKSLRNGLLLQHAAVSLTPFAYGGAKLDRNRSNVIRNFALSGS